MVLEERTGGRQRHVIGMATEIGETATEVAANVTEEVAERGGVIEIETASETAIGTETENGKEVESEMVAEKEVEIENGKEGGETPETEIGTGRESVNVNVNVTPPSSPRQFNEFIYKLP